ncbi:MAG: hypothetical protein J6Z82_04270 [Schwartzia sp.]|nr:hypothetical protein [Schwartzia sp. (in: firmicutes)]
MAVPEGIPLMLVFTGIFVFLVLFVACIVLSIIVEDTMVRAGLVMGALMLVLVMGGGAYMTMIDAEEPAKQAEAVVEQPKKEDVKQSEKPKPAAAPEAKPSKVELVVDESTLKEDFDPLKTDRLSVEDPPKGTRFSGNSRQERTQVGQKITAIETDLNKQLVALDTQVQEVLRRFDAQEMENYDMIFWQAKLKKQQYGYIVRAMDEKQKIVEKAASLSDEEKAADLARIDKRRQKALEKWKEYHGVLEQLMANQDVFRTL